LGSFPGFLTAVADVPTALLSPEAIPVLKDVDILLLHVHPFYERVQVRCHGNLHPGNNNYFWIIF